MPIPHLDVQAVGASRARFALTARKLSARLLSQAATLFSDLTDLSDAIPPEITDQAQASDSDDRNAHHPNDLNQVKHVNLRQNGAPL
jgi:hypothetical protein